MAEPTKADMAGELDKRVRSMEKFAAAGAVLGTIALALIGLFVSGYTSLVQTIGELKQGPREVADVKTQHAADLARVEKSIDKLEARLESRGRDVKTSYQEPLFWYQEKLGQVARVGDDSITLAEAIQQRKIEDTFKVAAGARVILLNGKTGTLKDLKKDGYALVLYDRAGVAQLIQEALGPGQMKKAD